MIGCPKCARLTSGDCGAHDTGSAFDLAARLLTARAERDAALHALGETQRMLKDARAIIDAATPMPPAAIRIRRHTTEDAKRALRLLLHCSPAPIGTGAQRIVTRGAVEEHDAWQILSDVIAERDEPRALLVEDARARWAAHLAGRQVVLGTLTRSVGAAKDIPSPPTSDDGAKETP